MGKSYFLVALRGGWEKFMCKFWRSMGWNLIQDKIYVTFYRIIYWIVPKFKYAQTFVSVNYECHCDWELMQQTRADEDFENGKKWNKPMVWNTLEKDKNITKTKGIIIFWWSDVGKWKGFLRVRNDLSRFPTILQVLWKKIKAQRCR